MNRIHFVAWALALLSLTGAPVVADQKLPGGHYKLTGVKVVPIERTDKGDEKSDKLTKAIRFDTEPQYEVMKGMESQPFATGNAVIKQDSRSPPIRTL